MDGEGEVLTTVFAATTEGKPGGYGIPNDVVAAAVNRVRGRGRGQHRPLHLTVARVAAGLAGRPLTIGKLGPR